MGKSSPTACRTAWMTSRWNRMRFSTDWGPYSSAFAVAMGGITRRLTRVRFRMVMGSDMCAVIKILHRKIYVIAWVLRFVFRHSTKPKISASTKAQASPTGPAHSAPSTPKKLGRISRAGNKKSTCRDREIKVA